MQVRPCCLLTFDLCVLLLLLPHHVIQAASEMRPERKAAVQAGPLPPQMTLSDQQPCIQKACKEAGAVTALACCTSMRLAPLSENCSCSAAFAVNQPAI
jgi:hypothetical protein